MTQELGQFSPTAFAGDRGQNCHITYGCFQTAYLNSRCCVIARHFRSSNALAFLMAPENHKRDSRDWNGMTRTFYAMPFGERYIWGATAGILRNLYERIYQE